MLQAYSKAGCPAHVQDSFTLDALEAAIRRGAHPSARSAKAAAALHLEVQEKVAQGYARLIPWEDLKKALPTNMRISPIAAIPHKSRDYRMILDLSYMFKIDGHEWPSVNDSSAPDNPPLQSMAQLGKVLPRLVHALATSPEDQGPWVFMKLDIKDGFWRLMVPKEEEYNFCYVLPQLNPDAPIQIVVPSSLQMGWKYSPPYFCAATETARDVAETLANQPELSAHPFEAITMSADDALKLHQLQHPKHWNTDDLHAHMKHLNKLLEVFVDDFCGCIQSTDPAVLLHHSRALLHAIHSIFPASPNPDTNPDDEPVSLKKLHEGEGVWAFRKEILGWIFDGIHRTIELPPGKLQKIRDLAKKVLRRQHCSITEFQSLVGKLQHACLAIPNGKGILSPLYKLMGTKGRSVQLPKGSDAHTALRDLLTIMKLVANRPTHCSQLVPGWPHYVGYCDACRWGAGGVWLSGKDGLHPVVWRLRWPADISARFKSSSNPSGNITINDLEMAGLLLQYLVLEQITPSLENKHAAAWCDNASTVSWAKRLASTRSLLGQRLLRALCIRHAVTKSSPLAPWSIAGANNKMADLASRSFKAGGQGNYKLSDSEFLTKFNAKFPLSQAASWHVHHLTTRITSLVFSELRQQQQPMGSWLRLAKPEPSSGVTGTTSSTTTLATPTPTSQSAPPLSDLPLSKPLPIGYELETQEEQIKLALSAFNKRWQPLPRPSIWLDSPAPRTSTKATPPTGLPSTNK